MGHTDNVIRAVLLVALSLLSLLSLPLFLGQLADQLSFTGRQLGVLSAAETAGVIFAGLVTLRFPVWTRQRSLVLGATICAALAQWLCAWLLELRPQNLYEWQLGCRLFVGFGEGVLLVSAYLVLSVETNSTRYYGLAMAAQSLILMVTFSAIPFINQAFDTQLAFSIITTHSLLLCAILSWPMKLGAPWPPLLQQKRMRALAPMIPWRSAAFRRILLGTFTMFAAQGAINTYIERIGHSAQLTASEIGLALTMATLCSVLAGLVSAQQGNRLGYRWPLLLAGVGQLFCLYLWQQQANLYVTYAVALCLYYFLWTYGMTYQLSLAGDIGPYASSAMPAIMAGGMAVGAWLSGEILQDSTSYQRLYSFSATLTLLGCVCLVFAVRAQQQRNQQAYLIDAKETP